MKCRQYSPPFIQSMQGHTSWMPLGLEIQYIRSPMGQGFYQAD